MAFTLPPTLTDTLAAVNVILSAIGEAPVSTIDTVEAPEAASALNVLEEMSRDVQTKGWPWNTDYQLALTPDNTARIFLPDNALRIAQAYPGPHSGKLVERGRKLYDPIGHTYSFDDAVIVDLVSKLPFEGMPEAARRYITIRAAQQFQGRVQSSVTVDRILDSQVALALTTLEEEVDQTEGYNRKEDAETAYRLNGRDLRRRY
jgi:hypothetical protein